MKSKEATRTYSYIFSSPVHNNERNVPSTCENSDMGQNYAKISFRYFGQSQDNTCIGKAPELDLAKFASNREKTTQPIKKYTFSGLTKHPREFYKSEALQPATHVASASKAASSFNPEFDVGKFRKSSVENEQEQPFSKGKKQGKTESSAQNRSTDESKEFQDLSKKIDDLVHENELLRVRADELRRINGEQEKVIENINAQLRSAYQTIGRQAETLTSLSLKDEESMKHINELIAKIQARQRTSLSLVMSSSVLTETIQPHRCQNGDPSFDEKSFLEEYKQIVTMFGFEPTQENCHQQVLDHIQSTQKSFEELTQLSIRFRDLEKQRNKLLQHQKKNESQISRLGHDNVFLNQELNKSVLLLSEYNEQINLMHLRQIEAKIAARYSEE